MTYTYDNDSRLTQAADATGTYAFSYDNLGRLGGTTTDYSFLTSRALTTSYSYDAASNRATLTDAEGGITSYSWDFENRLASATPGGGTTVGFKYDPFGRRIEKVSSTTTSIYVYDGDNLIEEINSAGSAVARYTQGLGIDEPLAMLRSGVTSYYEADGLGSVTSLSNSSGTVAASYDFDSYGNLTSSTGTLTNSFRYTAREFDSETGLYYYRARYYDPTSGRFLSEDPIRLGGRINYYAYVRNSPIGRIDPFGLCDEKNCLKGLRAFP